MNVPGCLPDPDKAQSIVNVTMVAEQMTAAIQKSFGASFAAKQPKQIGDQGWSAPFDKAMAKTALDTTGYYQCAMNLFALKLHAEEAHSINWRNVKYLSDFYWKTASSMATGSAFSVAHFPHVVHAIVKDPASIEQPWGWGVFDKLMGTEITLAFCYAVVCAIERKDDLEPWKTAALTAQVKFHVLADQVTVITRRMQFTEHIAADNKALGFSALQEAEQIKKIIEILQLKKGSSERVSNAELHQTINLQRASAAELVAGASDVSAVAPDGSPGAPDVSAGAPPASAKLDAASTRMLDITIKIARTIIKFPDVLAQLRFMEQKYGKECLCDSPAKLEKIIQRCGGAESPTLGEHIIDVLNGIAVMLKRGEVPGGASKITVPVLGGNPSRDQLGLIDRIMKRSAIVKYLYERFPLSPESQQALVGKFATFKTYDENIPIIDRSTTSDLTWMSSRGPACAALTNLMKKIWDGEMDEHIKVAMKNTPGASTPLDWINATEFFKAAFASVQAEWDLATKAASAVPGVSTGAAEEAASAQQSRDQARSSNPLVGQLWSKAGFRRAESCSLVVGGSISSEILQQIQDSVAGKAEGEFGTKHVAIIGDFGVLPDNGSRPWNRSPMYTVGVAGPRSQAGREFFELDGNEHVIMIFFDATREGNRAPIRKMFEQVDTNLGKVGAGKESGTREFFIQTLGRAGENVRGTGTAGDVEMMFVKTRQPVSQIKKKARIHHDGSTASVLYPNVVRPPWKKLPQCDAATKTAIYGDVQKPCTDSVDPTKWDTLAARKKSKIPKTLRGSLPLNFWEHSVQFLEEVVDNFNITAVIDLFGSANLAIACVSAEPPKPYVAILRNDSHVRAVAEAIDSYIVREMGREGPPASKFYQEEMKELVKELFPDGDEPGDDEADSEEPDSGGSGADRP